MTNEPNAQIVNFSDLRHFLGDHKTRTIVLVGGCFDILHLGHVKFLEKAKALGNTLVVALESDAFIKEQKKRDPFHNQTQRSTVLSSLRSVDLVIKMPYFAKSDRDREYRDLVLMTCPKYIAVSENDKMLEKKKDHAKLVGARVKVVTKLFVSLSSSTIAKYGALLSN